MNNDLPPIILGPIDFTCPLSFMTVISVLKECGFNKYAENLDNLGKPITKGYKFLRFGFKLKNNVYPDIGIVWNSDTDMYNEYIADNPNIKIYTLEEFHEKFTKTNR